MKGVKDEDKNMSPMFPRLHVGDTEKGGPRAPPRNKMALYEQLSVPSTRFSSGSAATLPSQCKMSSSVPVASGAGHERVAFPSTYISPTSADSDDNVHSHSSDGMSLRTKVHKSGAKAIKNYITSNAECGSSPPSKSKNYPNNLRNDNDLSIPGVVSPGIIACSNKHQYEEKERFTPLSPIHSTRSTNTSGNSIQKAPSATCNSSTYLHNFQDTHLKRTNTTDLWSRQNVRNQNEENLLGSVTSKDYAERFASRPFTRQKTDDISKHTCASPDQEHQNSSSDDSGELHAKEYKGLMQQESRAATLAENIFRSDNVLAESVAPSTVNEDTLPVRNEFSSRASLGNDRGSCNEYCDKQIHGLSRAVDVDKNDDASDTSMVDSISGFDISPDDVVGVIGQKHFWKARRAIINQQRLFAVQVFELHRLIKVQKLIAGSPHLLLEDTAHTKPSLKAAPARKQSVEYLLKSPTQTVNQRAESQKPNQIFEHAAENVVVKPSLPSVGEVNREHPIQQSSHEQHHGNLTSTPVTDSNKTGWSFQPPPGNQWLVPVMSPSEGLVYKPFTGPCPPNGGFMAPIYGGCGRMSLPSMGGEFPSPYGIPGPQHQGIGIFPNAPPYAQPYFSPYGMSMMNPVISSSSVDRVNPFAGAQSREHTERISTGEVNFNKYSRTSHNISNQKSDTLSSGFPKSQTFKESEIQGSTASSPGERTRRQQVCNISDGRDALPLFPMAPTMQDPDELPEAQNSGQQHSRVIKVVPHNPRSATESAARIFQSIQDERQTV